MKRRIFLKTATHAATHASLTAAALSSVACAADTPTGLAKTQRDAEGPFYPVVPIPLENNLLLSDAFVGDELLFTGRVLDTASRPIAQVRIEIWQCDGNSVYRHPRANSDNQDPAFRGYGATITDDNGNFKFSTIVPVPYPGRPPHIHVKLISIDKTLLTTQIYLHGFSGPDERKLSTEKISDSYMAQFDMVV